MLQASEVIPDTSEEEGDGGSPRDGLAHLFSTYSADVPTPQGSPRASSPPAPTPLDAHHPMPPQNTNALQSQTSQQVSEPAHATPDPVIMVNAHQLVSEQDPPAETDPAPGAGPAGAHPEAQAAAAEAARGREAAQQGPSEKPSGSGDMRVTLQELPASLDATAHGLAQQSQPQPSPLAAGPHQSAQQLGAQSRGHHDIQAQSVPSHSPSRPVAVRAARSRGNGEGSQGHEGAVERALASGTQQHNQAGGFSSNEPGQGQGAADQGIPSFPDGVGINALVPYGEADAALLSPRSQDQHRPSLHSPSPRRAESVRAGPPRDHLLDVEQARVSLEVSCLGHLSAMSIRARCASRHDRIKCMHRSSHAALYPL